MYSALVLAGALQIDHGKSLLFMDERNIWSRSDNIVCKHYPISDKYDIPTPAGPLSEIYEIAGMAWIEERSEYFLW